MVKKAEKHPRGCFLLELFVCYGNPKLAAVFGTGNVCRRINFYFDSFSVFTVALRCHLIFPSPPMSAVISSMRSMGKGGAQSGFIAMLISFIGLSSAATRFDKSAPQRLQR